MKKKQNIDLIDNATNDIMDKIRDVWLDESIEIDDLDDKVYSIIHNELSKTNYIICHKCEGKNTHSMDDFGFCKHCLAHL